MLVGGSDARGRVRLDLCWGRPPITGSFNESGNGNDIFWYSTTGGTETIWSFDEDRQLSVHSAPQVSFSGYQATSVNDDWPDTAIVFYQPGPGVDYVWGGVRAGEPAPERSIKITINGTYQLIPFMWDLLLYAPGPAPDRLITRVHDDGTMDVVDATINGTYRIATFSPPNGDPYLFFHTPGPGPDYEWTPGESYPGHEDNAQFLD